MGYRRSARRWAGARVARTQRSTVQVRRPAERSPSGTSLRPFPYRRAATPRSLGLTSTSAAQKSDPETYGEAREEAWVLAKEAKSASIATRLQGVLKLPHALHWLMHRFKDLNLSCAKPAPGVLHQYDAAFLAIWSIMMRAVPVPFTSG